MRSVIISVVMVLLLAGCASGTLLGAGQGGQAADGRSYEDARADSLLSAAVTKLLVRDTQVKAADINVATRDGVVTLSGQVPEQRMVDRAVMLVRSIDGVKQVVSQLRVGP